MNPPGKYHLADDGSIFTTEGDLIFCSLERFRRDICEGQSCFICGNHPDSVAFNDEHVIPDWILREFGMHNKSIGLPNGESCKYDRYKVRCCAKCNSLLGNRIELRVSRILKGGMNAVASHLKTEGPWLLFVWLSLLFLKTHLRDKSFRWHLDPRQGNSTIADGYDWSDLHHIHCIARACFTKPQLDRTVLGTFIALPATVAEHIEPFDYADLYFHRSVCFRFRDIALISVLNDSCGCYSIEKEGLIPKINGTLSPLQIREIMARLGYLNILINPRPVFHSEFSDEIYRIAARLPENLSVQEWVPEQFGRVMSVACSSHLENLANPDINLTKKHIEEGRYTFLFDENDQFIKRQLIPVPR